MLRSQIVAIAAHYLGVAESDVELANSRAAVRDDPTRSVGFAELAYRAYYEPQQLPPACPRRWRPPRASPRRRRSTGPTPPTPAPARSTWKPGRSSCCATSSAKTWAR
ncbi:aerobic-type carbon monoxide dehydrogenase, CoxL domain protein [Mycobacterium xenopi 4042]|uniref:Aerobic-type carbon monoxide dehydrogenase, CoxL domain protein n=1 Tax=Mycobacterium xenopi 4042 TaxID=1299334 RepID=X8DIU4_MYCXE|nr:aerobic-type carbon monoxide dehydrogenase, CoxL domain protein [Mycobacterium xenopi 4042]